MIKLHDKVKLRPGTYDDQPGLVEWLKHYMGENIDYYNIIWVVKEKLMVGYELREEINGLNASSFNTKEMVRADNALERLKKRYAVHK